MFSDTIPTRDPDGLSGSVLSVRNGICSQQHASVPSSVLKARLSLKAGAQARGSGSAKRRPEPQAVVSPSRGDRQGRLGHPSRPSICECHNVCNHCVRALSHCSVPFLTVLRGRHHLHTIMESDRVLVLDSGKVAEFDSPQNLLADHDSRFYSLAAEAGLVKTD